MNLRSAPAAPRNCILVAGRRTSLDRYRLPDQPSPGMPCQALVLPRPCATVVEQASRLFKHFSELCLCATPRRRQPKLFPEGKASGFAVCGPLEWRRWLNPSHLSRSLAMQRHSSRRCSDCESQLDRRSFIAAVGGASLAGAAALTLGSTPAFAAPTAKSSSDRV
jgi:hypothetical protein